MGVVACYYADKAMGSNRRNSFAVKQF